MSAGQPPKRKKPATAPISAKRSRVEGGSSAGKDAAYAELAPGMLQPFASLVEWQSSASGGERVQALLRLPFLVPAAVEPRVPAATPAQQP